MEIALTASETGHVVYSTLHTISAGQTINRILGMFGKEEEQQIRERLTGSLRYIVWSRAAPGSQNHRRTPVDHRVDGQQSPFARSHYLG